MPKTKAMVERALVNGGLTVTGLTAQEATGRRIRNLESVLNGGGPEIDVRSPTAASLSKENDGEQ